MYQADPNDNTKQIPRGLSAKVFSHAETPAAETVTKNPSYILINLIYFINAIIKDALLNYF